MLPLDYNFKKYLNMPFSVIDSISKIKVSKDVEKLIGINSQLDLINIYGTFHQMWSISTFQQPMQHLPRYTISLIIKYIIVYVKSLENI